MHPYHHVYGNVRCLALFLKLLLNSSLNCCKFVWRYGCSELCDRLPSIFLVLFLKPSHAFLRELLYFPHLELLINADRPRSVFENSTEKL